MTRPLLHPLRAGGTLTRGQPGRWELVQRAEQVAEIQLTQHVERGSRPRISSIPSPWARLQLFRDAILDSSHPAHEDVVNDVLDAVEIVLFQRSLTGVRLKERRIGLADLEQTAKRERKTGVARFLSSLRELAPDVGVEGPLNSVTMVFNEDRLLFATSPFTLIFTAEENRSELPGYFTRSRPIRPLRERPPLLARYARDVLIPQLGHGRNAALPELQQLSRILETQLAETQLEADAEARFVDAGLHTAPGITLHRVEGSIGRSPLAIKPTRDKAQRRAPLLLDNSSSPAQRHYFDWLERPSTALISADLPRTVLPGTPWMHEWISPEYDFLSEKLIILDSPVFQNRVHGVADESDSASRVLLPLTPRFFEFFTAQDAERMLRIRVQGPETDPTVHVRLSLPTVSGHDVVLEKEYKGSARLSASLSLWPGFVASAEPSWRDYYLICYTEGEDVGEALDLEAGGDGEKLSAERFQRDLSTVIHHLAVPPEYVLVRQRQRTVGDLRVAQGVLLPKLRPVPQPTQPAWTVAIDFGTSNTVVAYRDGGRPQPLVITEATRFDLTRSTEGAVHVGSVLDTFFFPSAFDGRPFGTVMLRSVNADAATGVSQIPAVTANVPFSGEVISGRAAPGGRYANEVVGDLKWGGGGGDSDRLTSLFLHQVLQLVHAEARGRGVLTDGMRLRWSYPSAFSLRKQSTTATRWQAMMRDFRERRLLTPATELPPGADARGTLSNRDEATSAMLYLRTDPAARGDFGPRSTFLKITADIGGGTTDVAGYANGGLAFHNSVLFGGRDLVGGAANDDVTPAIFSRIHEWALRAHLPNPMRRVLDAYPTQHAKFTYLVRSPWFAQQRAALAGEPWFPSIQACILYFFAAIHYHIGLCLRTAVSADVQPPDFLFYGGNGSGYLHWLTEFLPWNVAPTRPAFSGLLQRVLEEGWGRPLATNLTILTSSRPKHEVALGLLEEEHGIEGDRAPSQPPVGEAIQLGNAGEGIERRPDAMLSSADLQERGVRQLRFSLPLTEREITRFHKVFIDQLAGLGATVDPQWRDVARGVDQVLRSLPEQFFDGQIREALATHLKRDDIGAVTIFVLEATAALRRLEHELMRQ
jgi:hypothetical protein